MSELQTLEELGIKPDEFEITMEDEADGGATIHVDFKSDEAEEIFRAACERAGISREQYFRKLILG